MWGGRRRAAGRKPIPGRRPPVAHRARPDHRATYPVHVTLRACPAVRSLRAASVLALVRRAIAHGSSANFRIIHFSVQMDHIHLIIEAGDRVALSRGVAGPTIRAARAINRALRRRGRVWDDRYHARDLRTPRETRTGIVYVLQNWKKHLRGARGIDGCSSGPWFDGWVARGPAPRARSPAVAPRTVSGS
jgi:REP element-mobilizing transposase RayT